jgi:hypothetical protein
VVTTPTPLTNSLYKELNWGGAGGGFAGPGFGGGGCSEDYPKSTPTVTIIANTDTDYGYLCLYGFKREEQILITFKSPDGKADAIGKFYVGNDEVLGTFNPMYFIYQTDPFLGDVAAGEMAIVPNPNGAQTIAEIIFWKPIGIPEGQWDVTVKTDSIYLKTKMNVGWPKTEPRFGWKYDQPSILERAPFIPYVLTGDACQDANSDENKTIQAFNLKPNQYYSVGVYSALGDNLELNNEFTILTDKYGKYQEDLYATQKNGPATYVVALLRPEPELGSMLEWVSYDHDCIRVKWKACPIAPYSGLEKGIYVHVNPFDPTPNFIRNKPGLTSKLIGKLQTDESARIIDGPECADNIVWWKIKTDSGIIGWTGEGQGSEVWLVQR